MKSVPEFGMGGGWVPSRVGLEECWGAREDTGLRGDGSFESRYTRFVKT